MKDGWKNGWKKVKEDRKARRKEVKEGSEGWMEGREISKGRMDGKK